MYVNGEKILKKDFRKTELGSKYYKSQLFVSLIDIILIISYVVLEFIIHDLHGILKIVFWILIFIVTSLTAYFDGLYNGAYRQYVSSRIIIN